MAKCTCRECRCGNTWTCLHAGQNPAVLPSGDRTTFCKCCVDDSEPPLDEATYHKPEFMES
jgi:hypothetical protein